MGRDPPCVPGNAKAPNSIQWADTEKPMTDALRREGAAALDDATLAKRVAAQDETALRELLRRHNQRLFRTARAILRDEAEAEDALQEAYLKAIRAIGGFRGDAKLSTWLTRIVANEALERLRKRKRAEVLPLEADVEPAHDPDAVQPETPEV